MILINEFNDTWNYTFLIVAFISIAIGTFVTLRKNKKNKLRDRRSRRSGE